MSKFNIKFRNTYKPVDILIPFHSNYYLLSECLESLITKTLGVLYTITLIDDGSPNNKFIKDLEKYKLRNIPLQYLIHEEQKGFAAALRTGFENTQNDWVLFLHSDCRIQQTDWLLNMLQSMQNWKDKGVKLVSAKVNNGGLGSFDENIIGTLEKRSDIITSEPLPLICALVHRDLFNNIGSFIKAYYPFGGEDLELFWRMKLYGYKQLVCGNVFVHHEGGATINNFKNREEIFNQNEKIFVRDIQELNSKVKRK